jgi:hypothetical protein
MYRFGAIRLLFAGGLAVWVDAFLSRELSAMTYTPGTKKTEDKVYRSMDESKKNCLPNVFRKERYVKLAENPEVLSVSLVKDLIEEVEAQFASDS